jgi:crotonobetainyl-CoA:carnitine CoA-transferase CaiB-like acyl-CoA transferase
VTDGPLCGVRVLDLADVSGALAGKLLAGLGADVVLAEPPGGSALRRIPPFWHGAPDAERSLFFWFYASGKQSIVATPDEQGALVAAADVVIDTALPGRAVDATHPRLVVASITPFGRTGPYGDWRGSDTVAQAMGGLAYVNGHPDGSPLRSLGLQAYHQAGVFAAIGVVAALLARESTGRGQLVDVSLQAAVAASLEHVPGFFHQDRATGGGRVPRRQGTLHWTRYFRVGRCKDGWVMHCTLGDWTSLLEWMRSDGFGTGLDDPAWEGTAYRQQHAPVLFDELDRWAAGHTVAELHEGAQLRRLPYAAVRAPEALLADPHLAARGFFVPIEHPDLGVVLPYPGAPFRMGESAWHVARPPRLDEHGALVRRRWLGQSSSRFVS